ncbi:NAD(P)H:quinone oxidoreductase [Streptomonospora salina]|uniref:NAD(P)H dehydrogenase (Quinone) n=1 Tax=Streptomonospora salina TaxID=104205 RepID=A0A841E8M6_9ACTN|nr:NAD(P)H:quinone oxidoreductase [Streptomonospora salina]MBB5998834.1 NAD(P)H dehydrogenase (quinone) [Streptomonospora salina]
MSEPVKLSIIYYSSTGTGYAIAREIEEAAQKDGADVRLRKVPELAPAEAIAANPAWQANVEATADVAEAVPDDVVSADAVIFGSPTRYGNIASQLKQFIDQLGPQWQQGLLADKVYSGFTSSATLHGGQESTLLALSNTFYHFGGIIVAPGYTDASKFADGNPYGTSHVDAQGNSPVDDVTRTAAQVQSRRVVRVAADLKAGKTAA